MNNSDAAAETAKAIGTLVGGLIALAILIIPAIFYLLMLQKTLNRCSPESRAMQPGMVWLLFIPLFNMVWHFFVVINMDKSLTTEFQKRGIPDNPASAKTLGLVMCGLFCGGIIPCIGPLIWLGGLVCWIIYWVKIAGFSRKLA